MSNNIFDNTIPVGPLKLVKVLTNTSLTCVVQGITPIKPVYHLKDMRRIHTL